jgi:predicted methyltransferase
VDDRVTAAIDHVARDRYVRTPDGRQLPQTSKPELIARMLQLLDVQLGHRVLEIGTGSGYSTALLAYLVGPGGQVISLDIRAHPHRVHIGQPRIILRSVSRSATHWTRASRSRPVGTSIKLMPLSVQAVRTAWSVASWRSRTRARSGSVAVWAS